MEPKRKGRSVAASTKNRGGSYKLPLGGYATSHPSRHNTQPMEAAYRNQVYKRTGSYGGSGKAVRNSAEFKQYSKHMHRANAGATMGAAGNLTGLYGKGNKTKLVGFGVGAVANEYASHQVKKGNYQIDKATNTKRSRLGGYHSVEDGSKKSFSQKHPLLKTGAKAGAIGALATTRVEKRLVHGSQANGGQAKYTRHYSNPMAMHAKAQYIKGYNKAYHASEGVAANRAQKRAGKFMGPQSKSTAMVLHSPHTQGGYHSGVNMGLNNKAKVGVAVGAAAVGYGGYKAYQHHQQTQQKAATMGPQTHNAFHGTKQMVAGAA